MKELESQKGVRIKSTREALAIVLFGAIFCGLPVYLLLNPEELIKFLKSLVAGQ